MRHDIFCIPVKDLIMQAQDKNRKEENWEDALRDDLNKMETDFPLSGGEEPLTRVNTSESEDDDATFEEDDFADED